MMDPSLRVGLADVMADPHGVAARLVGGRSIYGLTGVEVMFETDELVVFWVTLEPWLATATEGYPTERVAVSVYADGTVTAVPTAPTSRLWLHRYPAVDLWWLGRSWRCWFASAPAPVQQAAAAHAYAVTDPSRLGQLCLWYPGDPRGLTWAWADGFEMYLTIVHRHLQAEEFWRRTGRWPAEDAPHGEGDHPIRTVEMQAAARRAAA